jgi:virginiamycin B lyase
LTRVEGETQKIELAGGKMLKRIHLLILTSGALGVLFYLGGRIGAAQNTASAAISGQVSSQEEGLLEGVLVSAKKEGSTITSTVISNDKGLYTFPANRLEPGRYSMRIRAAGYDLVSPGLVEVTAAKPTQLNLKLAKSKDLAGQLSNAEWLMSMPGTKEQKVGLYNCVMCHSLERVTRSHHNADEWMQVLARMNYYVGSTPLKPQRRPPPPPEEIARAQQEATEREKRFVAAGGKLQPRPATPDGIGGEGMEGGRGVARRAQAEWLATINLSQGPTWSYELKTLPRPKGRGTRAIYTTYDMPRKETMVHDADFGPDGMVWYTDFGSQYMGMLDPKTGKVTEYKVPILNPGFPEGLMDIRFDKDGNAWMGMMAQGGIAKFDKATQKIITYKIPPPGNTHGVQIAMVMPYSSHVDGKVWTNNVGPTAIQRLDVKTGQIETIFPYRNYTKDPRDHGVYGINADADNNLYVNDITSNLIVRIDAKTLESKFYEVPTQGSAPRRGRMDANYNLWVALSRADKFALLDTKTGEVREIASPTPFSQIYDIMPDKYGDVWAGGMTSDFVYRLNPKTNQIDQYLLPKINTNIRRVDVDDSQRLPAFWVGDDQSPTIYRMEVLD